MAKGSTGSAPIAGQQQGQVSKALFTAGSALDPDLAILFASSAGPITSLPKPQHVEVSAQIRTSPRQDSARDEDDYDGDSTEEDDEDLSSIEEDIEDVLRDESEKGTGHLESPSREWTATTGNNVQRKRKRADLEDDIEGKYMQKIAREEAEEEDGHHLKSRKLSSEEASGLTEPEIVHDDPIEEDTAEHDDESLTSDDVPQHETLALDRNTTELEKSARTVFLANVSTSAIRDKKTKRTLLNHMESFLESLPPSPDKKPHKVESIRFRSTAYSDSSLPKKAAYVTKALMDATTRSTNAYVVYSTLVAAREAVKRLNGTVVLDRHLRVDSVAHPSKIDHRRCVFVGNLGFVDDENVISQAGDTIKKQTKVPSDIEEGLWRQFGKAGTVESVRVVRDEKTRVGKGFAYVQFKDANSVEAALLFHDKKFPPMLPRPLRVARAKALKKTANASQNARPSFKKSTYESQNSYDRHSYRPKATSQEQSLQGRAGRLLGKAGAAQLKTKTKGGPESAWQATLPEGVTKSPEEIVFEGYRATSNQGRQKGIRKEAKGARRKAGTSGAKRTNRAAEWKKRQGTGYK